MKPKALQAVAAPAVMGSTLYPPPYDALVKGRLKRKLGDVFGLTNFGINLTDLQPGSMSALAHHHSKQDEFIYVVHGTLTLVLDNEEQTLQAGDCYGFKAGTGVAHHLINKSNASASYLEIGDRSADDRVEYTDADLKLNSRPDGSLAPVHKDGRPY